MNKKQDINSGNLQVIPDESINFTSKVDDDSILVYDPTSIILKHNGPIQSCHIAFKVKTTLPHHYIIIPNHGLIAPNSNQTITIKPVSKDKQSLVFNKLGETEKALINSSKDKFLIQFCDVSSDLLDQMLLSNDKQTKIDKNEFIEIDESKFKAFWNDCLEGDIHSKKLEVKYSLSPPDSNLKPYNTDEDTADAISVTGGVSTYNLVPIESPRLVGPMLNIVPHILRLPIIGRIITNHLKSSNKLNALSSFVRNLHELPLFYPLHNMTDSERLLHDNMSKTSSLDMIESLAKNQNHLLQKSTTSQTFFRHWTVYDYVSRYITLELTPTQVIENIIHFVETVNQQNPIIVMMNKDELRREAAASTHRYAIGQVKGVLDGVPIAVKDEIPVLNYPLTKGTSFIRDKVNEDAIPVIKLRGQGALIIGKTNQHEIGLGTTGHNRHYGCPRNPYNSNHYTGGSSSGSAAAVSIGLVPIALGTDGGGSIRIPSALCGVVGLKPTFKRIPMDFYGSSTVVHVGPIAGSVTDAALAYAIMAGASDDDFRQQSKIQPPVHLFRFTETTVDNLIGIRIGIFTAHLEDSDPLVVSSIRNAIKFFESHGATIIEVETPHLNEIHLAHSCTILSELSSSMDQYYKTNINDFSPEVQISMEVGRSLGSIDYIDAQKIRSFAMRHIENMFQTEIDILLSPATSTIAPEIKSDVLSHGESNLALTAALMKYMIFGNFVGIPGIVFPVAYDPVTRLPISVQLQAAHWREDLLFHLARVGEGILKNGWNKPDLYVNIIMK